MMIYLCCLILLFAILFYTYCKKCNNYWKNKGVASVPPQLFVGNLGNVLLLKEGFIDCILNGYTVMKQNKEPFVGAYFFTRPVLVLIDLDLIKNVSINNFDNFFDRPFYCNEDRDPLSAHLISLKGEKWKKMRSKLTPVFTPGKLRMMFHTIISVCDQFTAVLDRKINDVKGIDINDEVTNALIDIIGSTCFGIDCNSTGESTSEFKRYGKEYLHNPSIFQFILLLLSGAIPEFFDMLHINIHNSKMTEFYINLVQDIVKFREENNVVRNDMMHILLQIKNKVEIDESSLGNIKSETKNGEELSINEIAAQCFMFFLGGFDTTSSVISFCIYELSLNSVLQDKAREDVLNVMKENKGKITYHSLQQMKYLDMCVSETLRKYPSAVGSVRTCTQTYKVPNSTVVIDKGTVVLIPIIAVHHDPEYYPNPEMFDPERFSEENKSKRHQFAWMPFGNGPRMCIGYRIALMQMKIVLVTLLQRYRWSLHCDTKVPTTYNKNDVIMSLSSRILLNLEKLRVEHT